MNVLDDVFDQIKLPYARSKKKTRQGSESYMRKGSESYLMKSVLSKYNIEIPKPKPNVTPATKGPLQLNPKRP